MPTSTISHLPDRTSCQGNQPGGMPVVPSCGGIYKQHACSMAVVTLTGTCSIYQAKAAEEGGIKSSPR